MQPLVQQFQHAQRIEEALNFVWSQDAKEAVRAALSALPIGTDERQIAQAKEAALARIKERIAEERDGDRNQERAESSQREEPRSRRRW